MYFLVNSEKDMNFPSSFNITDKFLTPALYQVCTCMNTETMSITNFVEIRHSVCTLHSSQFSEPLGMEDGAISDVQISASSQRDAGHAASKGRLNSGKVGSWSPYTDNALQWLQIDLGDHYTRATDVATQGGNATDNWVTKYKLQYSDDGIAFTDYTEREQCTSKVRENSCIEL